MRTAALIGIVFFLTIAVGAVGWLLMPTEEPFPLVTKIHYYRNPIISLNDIHVTVYHVRSEENANSISNFREKAAATLRKIVRFHSVQFLGKSLISYEISPDLLSAALPNNPNVLQNRGENLLNRLSALVPAKSSAQGAYEVALFVIDGGGLGARPGAAYVPAALFIDPKYDAIRESVIYHTLGLAFGLPEGGEGIMGTGMFRPIDINFIEPELVRQMGLLD